MLLKEILIRFFDLLFQYFSYITDMVLTSRSHHADREIIRCEDIRFFSVYD